MTANTVEHAKVFARHLKENVIVIHDILRKCQSKEVVDDEITRSVDALESLSEIEAYFVDGLIVNKVSSFLPLNLPLYSFILFAAMPSYQAQSVVVRPPHRMTKLFKELADRLGFAEYYPTIEIFDGSRDMFVSQHCTKSAVVLFTGKHKNSLAIRKQCSKETLFLYNGVGHNPIVVTPSADIDLAVQKCVYVKLFNNGQDCAGPDAILVHDMVADEFVEKLKTALSEVKVDTDYDDPSTKVGPLFETGSLLEIANFAMCTRDKGAEIIYGGKIDLKHNVMHPVILEAPLSAMNNFVELYAPLFFILRYNNDQELSLYFNDVHFHYKNRQMYVSLFGNSEVVRGALGSIILKDCTIHDVERGTEEYGGFSPEASAVSYKGLNIYKPLLIPREIWNYLHNEESTDMLAEVPRSAAGREQILVSRQFEKKVQQIFKGNLEFAFIFGSFAAKKDVWISDFDTLICVHEKDDAQVEEYLQWVFYLHEFFGRIPDFKYPSEIITMSDLEAAEKRLQKMKLSATKNNTEQYDAMIWFHALSQTKIGQVFPENIPEHWKHLFPDHSLRLLLSFLVDLDDAVMSGKTIPRLDPRLYELPCEEPLLSRYLNNLNRRGLVQILKMIPFNEDPQYADKVLKMVAARPFMGRSVFYADDVRHLYNPYFRFGVVSA